jgi:alanyl-tRNA synthetase
VAPERLRFDFTHLAALTMDELRRVEAIVNAEVRANLPVTTRVTTFDEAVKGGAIALFGEKYGDLVRVVSAEGFTAELCGGTHLRATGQIGLLHIVGESSVGSGLRRIEAVTGRGAEAYIRERLDVLLGLADVLVARPGEELQRAEALQGELRAERRSVQDLQRQLAAYRVETLLGQALDVRGAKVLVAEVAVGDVNALRELSDRFRDKLGSAVVALGAVIGDRPLVVVAVTQDLVARGLHAGKLAGAAANHMGGGGGGKPNMAQAGGKDVSRLAEALAVLKELVSQTLG